MTATDGYGAASNVIVTLPPHAPSCSYQHWQCITDQGGLAVGVWVCLGCDAVAYGVGPTPPMTAQESSHE
jgi:hypothetical protein